MSASAPSAPLCLNVFSVSRMPIEQPAREPGDLRARERPRRPAADRGRRGTVPRSPGCCRSPAAALVDDRHLDRQPRAREPVDQPIDVDAVIQRIGPERRDVRQRLEARVGDQPEAAEQAEVRVVQSWRRHRDRCAAARSAALRRRARRWSHFPVIPRCDQTPTFAPAHPFRFRPNERHEQVLSPPLHVLKARARERAGAPAPRRPKDAAARRSALTPRALAPDRPAPQVARGDFDLG